MRTSTRWSCLAIVLLAAMLVGGCGSALSRKASYVRHGRDYMAAGNYDKARVEFRNALQIDPKDAGVRVLLGQLAEKTGDVREAFGQYQAALQADPKMVEARVALGRFYVYAGLADKAIELVEVGLANDPKNSQLLTIRGAARARLGNLAGALSDAQTAVQADPSNEYAIAVLVSLYRRSGDLPKAIQEAQAGEQRLPKNVDLRAILADLYQAAHRNSEAEAQLQQAIALEPTVTAHRYSLARFYLLQKDIDAAERTLRGAVAASPKDDDAKLQLVEFLFAQRGADRATAQVDQFVAAAPKDDGLRLSMGEVLARSGQRPKAEEAFRAVIARAGDEPDGLTARDNLAALLLASNDVAGARALIDQVLKRSEHDNDALALRANIALTSGDAAAAITDLRAVLRDQPNAVPLMRGLATAYAQSHELDLAEETLRNALQVAPDDADSRLQLAQVLVADNKSEEAEPVIQQLAAERPMDVTVQSILFRAQAENKRYDDARNTAIAIEKARPDLALGFYLTGLIDEQQSKPQDAARDYEQALKLQPQANEPLTALVNLDMRTKQPGKALGILDDVIARYPQDTEAYSLKAELLISQRQYDAAAAEYQQAVQAAPIWAPGYRGLAMAQFAGGHSDEAIQTMQQGIDKTRGSPMLITILGNLYERLNRPADAIALYDDVLAKNPNSLYAANNLAMLLVNYRTDAASLQRARALTDQLIASSAVDVIDTRGWVKFKSGDYRSAENLLQQAVDKAPNSAELRYHLGMAEYRNSEPQAAAQNLGVAVHSSQPFFGIDEARSVLAQLKKSTPAG